MGAVVDVAVIGARGDGKTQFIVHAIRTLRAYAPLLDGDEHQYNRDVLKVVMSAREPRPEATAPGVVPHYVFRIRPDSLLSQVGFGGRLSLYARVAHLWRYMILALLNAALVAALLVQLRGGFDQLIAAATLGLLAVGTAVGALFARREFIRRGDIEIVFWDVAGEHVYESSAADYYSFLSALARRRRQRASDRRSYAFAPVLICNPISLGTRSEGSPYSRLRQLMPLFASLNEPLPRALVAINRWAVVKEVCAPDADRDEVVAIAARARSVADDSAAASVSGAQTADDSDNSGRRQPLPLVERDVVRRHCLDAEDGAGDDEDRDIHFSYLRYDAGIQCEFERHTWSGWQQVDSRIKGRWRAPTRAEPSHVLEYIYEDGPGSFRGEVRRGFLHWLAGLAFHKTSYGAPRPRVAPAGATDQPAFADGEAQTPAAADPPAPKNPATGAGANARADIGAAAAARRDPAPVHDRRQDAWKPRPLSANGLEQFSRDTIAQPSADSGADSRADSRADEAGDFAVDKTPLAAAMLASGVLPDAQPGNGHNSPSATVAHDTPAPRLGHPVGAVAEPQPLTETRAEAKIDTDTDTDTDTEDDDGADSGEFKRESTAPGIGIAVQRADTGQPTSGDTQPGPASRQALRSGDTMPMPGGFGSGGT